MSKPEERLVRDRLLKKAQPQGAVPKAERGVLMVRRSDCQGAATPRSAFFSSLLKDSLGGKGDLC